MLYKPKSVRSVVIIYNAFSLIEVLISITLGTIILLSVISLYSQSYRNEKQYLEKINLQMQAHQFIDYLKHHLQHSGYLGYSREKTNYTEFLIKNKSYYITRNCILFFYDANKDGRIDHSRRTDPDEIFGFKFNKNEIYEIKISYSDYTYKKDMICNSEHWKSITKDFQFIVHNLNFIKQSENIIKIYLELKSRKDPKVIYQIMAYTYLLNGNE